MEDRFSISQRRRRGGRGWIFAFVLGVLSLLIMLLVHVWISIERMDTSYSITRIQEAIKEKRAHLAKLEVEHERLLTPHELRQKAQALGMHEPNPGQIRSIQK
ncbi:MAG: hypothetical protein IK079_01865 [Desulfovibrio sp.]|nr:hypothetical protein [Desulfovibrio sp.]